MDRNNIIGFALIFAVLLAWSYFNAKQSQQQVAQKKIQDSIALVKFKEDSAKRQFMQATDTTVKAAVNLLPQNGFNTDSTVKPGTYVLENDKLKVTFSNYGGKIMKAELKNFFKMRETRKGPDDKLPLILLEHPDNEWNLTLDQSGNKVHTRDILFSAIQKDSRTIEFGSVSADGKQIKQSYTLEPDSYTLHYQFSASGTAAKAAHFDWTNTIISQEKNAGFEKTYTTLHYKPENDDSDHLKWGADDQEKITTPIKWISSAQQFFNTSIIADKTFENASFTTTPYNEENQDLINKMKVEADLPFGGESINLKLYIGPNELSTLKAQGHDLDNIIAFGAGILGSINKHVIRPVFNFLSQFIGNKGIVILILTFIVKLALFPLSYKMLHSQAKMSALKPEMAHLKEKFKDDPQQMQMESMKIYREFGVNPLGGCLPMLLQMPIWFALYQFFPASLEFRQSSFLWATDLSSYDVFAKLPFKLPFYGGHISLFTLIWVISTLVFTYYSTKDQDFSMNPAMKYMQYFMPLFFLFFFNNSASGLTAYMSFSNILNIAQTLGGKALLFPEAKMKAELHAAKAKPKKKGGFQERLESMMKEQQSKMETRQKSTKK